MLRRVPVLVACGLAWAGSALGAGFTKTDGAVTRLLDWATTLPAGSKLTLTLAGTSAAADSG